DRGLGDSGRRVRDRTTSWTLRTDLRNLRADVRRMASGERARTGRGSGSRVLSQCAADHAAGGSVNGCVLAAGGLNPRTYATGCDFFASAASRTFWYFFWKRLTRPSVSISFWRPVKKGWQLEQISTRISPL